MTMATSGQHPSRKLVLTTSIPVRWGDMDAYRHVNNTIYFRYFEQARVEWLEQSGSTVSLENPVAPVIINASCTFLIPVNYPATVVVRMYLGEPGRSSVMTWYELGVEGDDRLFAEGAAKVVWMDPVTGKSVPLPDDVRAGVS
ncbi:MAG TPA: thioesterase family protein [Zoogloea sp.]|jgi:acyl-CoA thioester hydrolase|uniref:acyl-CoA thioesterase n=1 Tax=Zoogloea sp. TaxID=49181 RepID=UPI002B9E4F74|nr:thioesterase family protein [Zoogloea sp.]HOB47083.1 thioesterase family protein [Zoogloea sp.]HQA11404.1 thioesterase family protein [Zoogloea sp.]